jgi:hypothetical protein
MTMNEGSLDRAIRIILGIALLSLTVAGPKTMLGLIGLVPLLTGIIGFCPLYRLVGLSTCPMPRKAPAQIQG